VSNRCLPPDAVTVRSAELKDINDIRSIERAAGIIYCSAGMDDIADPPSPDVLTVYILSDHTWVAADTVNRPVGYLLLRIVDHHPHIEKVSSYPEFEGLGIRKYLVDHVSRWAREGGFQRITLTTFENVPWNAMYYQRLGFRKTEEYELGRGMFKIREEEEDAGLTRWPRVVMSRPLWGADSV
jgi:GNAT superfamily N-acetyltransferase